MGRDEPPVLLGGAFDPSAAFVRMAAGGEDLPAPAKAGVFPVAAFLGGGHAQTPGPELIGGLGIEASLCLHFLDFLNQRGNDFEEVGDDSVSGDFEDGRFLVLIDGHDRV